MLNTIKNWFGSGDEKPLAGVAYNGYTITPTPKKIPGGYSTEATITRDENHHNFIRADTSPTRESATELIINKAKTMIDQQGEKIFEAGKSHK